MPKNPNFPLRWTFTTHFAHIILWQVKLQMGRGFASDHAVTTVNVITEGGLKVIT